MKENEKDKEKEKEKEKEESVSLSSLCLSDLKVLKDVTNRDVPD